MDTAPSGRPGIVVTRRLPGPVESDLVARFGAKLNRDDHQLTADELAAAMCEADIVLCTLTEPLTRAVFVAGEPLPDRIA